MAHTTSQRQEQITFLIANTGALIRQARQLCHDVYLCAGYISHAYPSRIIPDDGGKDSVYIIALDSSGAVVGTIRLSTAQPCRTIDVWNGRLYHEYAGLICEAQRKASFEIGALAVNKACSPLKVSWGLYNMAYRWALANKKEYGIISMDQRAFRALEMVGWHALQVGEPMNYFGSLTVPAIIPIMEQPIMAAAKAQPWFKYLTA